VKLQHHTDVSASPEDVWSFLQDTRAVVGCLPGAELVDDLGDDRYQGLLKVAVGPLKMAYAGDVSVVERDADAHRMVLDASGRDKRGSGAVQAHVRLQVAPIDAGSRIDVVSDVELSGRIASLGRGVKDVSNQMFVEFASRLGDRVEHPGATTAGSAEGAVRPVGASPSAPSPATGSPSTRTQVSGGGGEIKVMALVWSVTRQRLADFLERLSRRVRPD
jgi:carbon monoxide dehydrogenase subunit G